MMRVLLFVFMSVISICTYAEVNCKFKITNPIDNWTGACENGWASGIGELSYTRKNDKVLTFGKFNKGHATGLHLTSFDKVAFISYWVDTDFNKVGPAYYSGDGMEHLIPMKQVWADSNTDSSGITYEEALRQTKAYIAQKSEPSIDFEIFKAYLEGKVRVTGEDDPPVLGAALKPSGGGKKKKR